MNKNFQNPFKSFWMAGFECADHMNAFGNRIDLAMLSGHLNFLEDDYKNLEILQIKTVREGLRWSIIEKQPYQYDWEPVKKMIKAAKQCNIQQVWDICHFGFPDDLTPLHPMFARRFAAFCKSFVQFYRTIDSSSILIITPVNEVSFLSWLGGDARGTVPYCTKQGWEVKYALMKAYIEGIEEMKKIDSSVRILVTEPLINIVASDDVTDEEIELAKRENESQFQVIEILRGNLCPELRGRPEYLDILGLNFYPNNQWIYQTRETILWNENISDHHWSDLTKLILNVHKKYLCPLIIAETSHTETHRSSWIKYIGKEADILLKQDIPLWAVCLYPIIDRPDWDFPDYWHRAGIWHIDETKNYLRTYQKEIGESVLESQRNIEASKFETIRNMPAAVPA